ncbi:hypothetical protein EBR96_08910 [bacterium]|nr:hypothetical protein [bacterium]
MIYRLIAHSIPDIEGGAALDPTRRRPQDFRNLWVLRQPPIVRQLTEIQRIQLRGEIAEKDRELRNYKTAPPEARAKRESEQFAQEFIHLYNWVAKNHRWPNASKNEQDREENEVESIFRKCKKNETETTDLYKYRYRLLQTYLGYKHETTEDLEITAIAQYIASNNALPDSSSVVTIGGQDFNVGRCYSRLINKATTNVSLRLKLEHQGIFVRDAQMRIDTFASILEHQDKIKESSEGSEFFNKLRTKLDRGDSRRLIREMLRRGITYNNIYQLRTERSAAAAPIWIQQKEAVRWETELKQSNAQLPGFRFWARRSVNQEGTDYFALDLMKRFDIDFEMVFPGGFGLTPEIIRQWEERGGIVPAGLVRIQELSPPAKSARVE